MNYPYQLIFCQEEREGTRIPPTSKEVGFLRIFMKADLDFQDGRIELEIPDDRLVGHWRGPVGREACELEQALANALEQPRDYPALRQAVVPGDHVTIALDMEIPQGALVVRRVIDTLTQAGIEATSITVLIAETGDGAQRASTWEWPEGLLLKVHDPRDRQELNYLATTQGGRRIYLNQHLTNADFVLPIGRIGFEPGLGYRGPWSVLYPTLSDEETIARNQSQRFEGQLGQPADPEVLQDAIEANWLLGCQFHLGLISGLTGTAEVVAGIDSAVRTQGLDLLNQLWRFSPESQADLVIAGVGGPGQPVGLLELAEGIANVLPLVQQGGKIAILSRAQGTLGPAFRHLAEIDDPRKAFRSLAGFETDPDLDAARLIAKAMSWADLYLMSALPSEEVEELSIIPLERPREVDRLIQGAHSCTVVNRADLTGGFVRGED